MRKDLRTRIGMKRKKEKELKKEVEAELKANKPAGYE